MKQILTIVFSFAALYLNAQIYTPVNPTVYGSHNLRLRADSAQHLPHKYSNTKNTTDTTPQVFGRNTKDLMFFINGIYHRMIDSSELSDTASLRVDTVIKIDDSTWRFWRTRHSNDFFDLKIISSGDNITIINTDSIFVKKKLRIPKRDTSGAPRTTASIIFDTLQSQFYGYNGIRWLCMSCTESAHIFGIEDNLGIQNRLVNMEGYNFEIDSLGYYKFISGDISYTNATADFTIQPNSAAIYAQNGLGQFSNISVVGLAAELDAYDGNTNSESFLKLFSDGTAQAKGNLDSSTDAAPNVVGIDVDGNWHRYNPNSIGQRFGIEDAGGVQGRDVDMGRFYFDVYNAGYAELAISNNYSFYNLQRGNLFMDTAGSGQAELNGYTGAFAETNIQYGNGVDTFLQNMLVITAYNSYFYHQVGITGTFTRIPFVDNYLVASITDDGGTHTADSLGNIDISGGGSGSRFAYSGEDDTQGESRRFILDGIFSHNFEISYDDGAGTNDIFRIQGSGGIMLNSQNTNSESLLAVQRDNINLNVYDIATANGDVVDVRQHGRAVLSSYQGFTVTDYVSNPIITDLYADPSAVLDVRSAYYNKGVLLPRMATSDRTGISSPHEALIVYDSTLHNYYFHNGTIWVAMSGSGGSARFGYAGEDDVAGEARDFDANNNTFKVHNSTHIYFETPYVVSTIPETSIDLAGSTMLFQSNSSSGDYRWMQLGSVETYIETGTGSAISNLAVGNEYISMRVDDGGSNTIIARVLPTRFTLLDASETNTTARTRLNIGATQNFASNAAAVTGGLGVGDVYRNGDVLQVVH